MHDGLTDMSKSEAQHCSSRTGRLESALHLFAEYLECLAGPPTPRQHNVLSWAVEYLLRLLLFWRQ